MRVDHIELGIAARRERAQAIATLFANGLVWLLAHASRLNHGYKRHAARPHFAR